MAEYRRTTTTKIIETIRLDGPVRPVPHSRGERTYRVGQVVAEWHRHDDGNWSPMTPRLFGPVLRKDGSDSKNRASESTWPKATPEDEWLAALLAAISPTTPGARS